MVVVIPSQYDKNLLLKRFPDKIPIWGAHGDINRMLRVRGLISEDEDYYLESEEWHHMNKTRDEYQEALEMERNKMTKNQIVAKIKEGKSGVPQFLNKEDEDINAMKARMRGVGLKPEDYSFSDPPVASTDERKDDKMIITLIEKLEEFKKILNTTKDLPAEEKSDAIKKAEEIKKELEKAGTQ